MSPLNRSLIQNQRSQLSLAEQHHARALIAKQCLTLPNLASFQHIGVYLAHQGEVSLQPLIDALWNRGHLVYLPCLQQDITLTFSIYTPHTPLQPNRFGILEPCPSRPFPAEQLDAVLVPLVYFDVQGHRIGMGKGYYDRTFAFRKTASNPVLIGCAYDFQEAPCIITPQAHDIDMDYLLTPSRLLKVKQKNP